MTTYCTDSVDYQKFRPHGRVGISVVDKSIVTFKALGPFNLELLAALGEVESDLLKGLSNNWVEVIIFEHSCLASKEVFLAFTAHLQAKKAVNETALASAFVFPKEVEGAVLMATQYKKCFDDAGLCYKNFDNQADALSWVQTFV